MSSSDYVMHEQLSLDGEWKAIFDHDNRGRTLGLQEIDAFLAQEDIETVVVPSVLEEYRHDYQGVAWYMKRFAIDRALSDRSIRIHFGAANYRTEAWLNGHPIGFHEGGYTDFSFDVSAFVRTDAENHLIVRIITPLITRDVIIDGLARDEAPHWRGAIGGGIWQPVTVQVTGPLHVREPHVSPDLEAGVARLNTTLVNDTLEPLEATVSATVKSLGVTGSAASGADRALHAREIATLTVEPGETPHEMSIAMGEFDLWSPASPHLYELELSVAFADNTSSSQTIRFGMREFSVKDTSFTLNGEPFAIKGAFYEGLYPHSLVFPRDLEVLRRTFQNAKDGGLNLIRPWRKPQPPVVYDLADEMGLLMVGALPIECMEHWPRMTPQIYQRLDQEVSEMVLRDRNHASIILWEMFNELWRAPLVSFKHKACLVARANDPDRLILDEAGGFAGSARMYMPGSRTPFEINDIHRYAGGPLSRSGYEFFRDLAKSDAELEAEGATAVDPDTRSSIIPGLLTNISEIGYGSMPDLSANRERYLREGNPLTPDYRTNERLLRSYTRVLQETGLMDVFGSLDEFVQRSQQVHSNANKLMVEACRLNPKIGGIMVHALTGGDWVVGAGLLDAFGEPKRSYYGTSKAFEPRYLAITPSIRTPMAGESIGITINSVNDLAETAATLTVELTDGAGTVVTLADRATVLVGEGIGDLWSGTLATDGLHGHCTMTASIEATDGSGEALGLNTTDLYVMDPFSSKPLELSLLDEDGAIRNHAMAAGYALHGFDPSLPTRVPLVISGIHAEQTMQAVADWVELGGNAVVLNLPDGEFTPHTVGHRQTVRGYLPMDVVYMQGHDLWSPSNHVMRAHPLCEGLPVNTVFDTVFSEVRPYRSIVSHREGWLCAAVFYHYYGRQAHKQNFTGVSEADFGADLVPVGYGNGTFYLCTLQIAPGIAYDRFSQRLLHNMASALGVSLESSGNRKE